MERTLRTDVHWEALPRHAQALHKRQLQLGKTLLESALKNGLDNELKVDAQQALRQVIDRLDADPALRTVVDENT